MIPKLLNYKLIGITLKKQRIINSYSIKNLARTISVSEHSVRNWENGIFLPSLTNIVKICNVYQIKVDDFIFYEK